MPGEDTMYLRAEKTRGREVPPAYVKVVDETPVEIRYYGAPGRSTGAAAAILFKHDLKPVCTFTEVDVDETPFGEGGWKSRHDE